MSALSTKLKFTINTGTFTATSVAIPSASVAPNGGNVFNSNPEKGDGYFGAADGLHTVTYTVTPNFSGTLTMQATLSVLPSEDDWFGVNNTTFEYHQPNAPLTTTTNYVNFVGNFVWVRAQVHRSSDQPNGSVNWVNYNR